MRVTEMISTVLIVKQILLISDMGNEWWSTEYGSMDNSRDVFDFLSCALNDNVTLSPSLCLLKFILF